MKKLFLVFGVLMGLVALSNPSYALRALDSTNKTVFNVPLVSSTANGNAAFVTNTLGGSTALQVCTTLSLGSGTSAGNLMSCGGTPITGISLSGGASGGTVTIYDANTTQAWPTAGILATANSSNAAECGPQEVVFEATVAASTQNYYDLSNDPINTNNGVVVFASSTSGAVVYTSPAIAANH